MKRIAADPLVIASSSGMAARFAREPLNGCTICIAYLALLDGSPTRDMCAHQRLEHPPVVRVTKVKQFMNDDVILERLILVEQIRGQGDGSRRWAPKLTYPVEARVQDRFAEGLLQTLIEIGPKILQNPQDYDLQANFMWVATLALNGLIGSGVPSDWATHMIGHEITALHGLDHAQTLAIILPTMLSVRRESKRAKLLQYAERVWHISEGQRMLASKRQAWALPTHR